MAGILHHSRLNSYARDITTTVSRGFSQPPGGGNPSSYILSSTFRFLVA